MRKRWTPRETQMLEQFLMDLPTDCVHQQYNAWASQNNMPLRTRKALMYRSRAYGMTANRACGEWVRTSYITSLLNISDEVLLGRFKRYKVPSYRDSRNWIYFRRSDLVKAAQAHPAIFRDAKPDDLFLLLENRELATQVASLRLPKGNDPRPVRLIETGRVYKSMNEAAASVYVTHRAIAYAIKAGTPAAGYHWAFA